MQAEIIAVMMSQTGQSTLQHADFHKNSDGLFFVERKFPNQPFVIDVVLLPTPIERTELAQYIPDGVVLTGISTSPGLIWRGDSNHQPPAVERELFNALYAYFIVSCGESRA